MSAYAEDLPLFEEPAAHARNSDPDTSHAAAASVRDITHRQRAVLEVLYIQGALADPDIALYYAQFNDSWPDNYPQQSESGLRTRRAELVARKLVEDTGRRHFTHTGRRCIVWRITAAGRAELLSDR